MTRTLDEQPVLLLSDKTAEEHAQEQEQSEIGVATLPRGGRRRGGSDPFATRQRKAREGALQVLFEVDLVGHDVADVRTRQFDQMGLAENFREFADSLVDGVLARRGDLDALIAAIAPAWPIAQLPRVDLNLLRLAVYELLYRADVPVGAVINEAVELAKRYGSENSGKFVNGTLGTVAARIAAGDLTRASEAQPDRA